MSEKFCSQQKTLNERLEELKMKQHEYKARKPDAPEWFSREYNEKQQGPNSIFWTAPYDVRYPQCKVTRQCFDYYVDYHRCITLLGAKHEPCNFFRDVYSDICPSKWIQLWDKQVEQGIFPARFNR
uniref:Cytochrome c oxidase subunit n=1 Tax=Setaria digitata TaxID=48799 RepID=A0A915PII1_9BILA